MLQLWFELWLFGDRRQTASVASGGVCVAVVVCVLYGEQGALTSVASSASPGCSPYRHEETVGKPRA